jgi:predicted metal-dependent hydrolase
VLRVSIPAHLSVAEEQRWVNEMLRRAECRQRPRSSDLEARARRLADRFGLERPAEIRWVDNQQSRWGSCTPAKGAVRISCKLAGEPGWVLDYVIVHELAHLHVSGHGKAFWRWVNRYPLAERARGFLIARGLGETETTL